MVVDDDSGGIGDHSHGLGDGVDLRVMMAMMLMLIKVVVMMLLMLIKVVVMMTSKWPQVTSNEGIHLGQECIAPIHHMMMMMMMMILMNMVIDDDDSKMMWGNRSWPGVQSTK